MKRLLQYWLGFFIAVFGLPITSILLWHDHTPSQGDAAAALSTSQASALVANPGFFIEARATVSTDYRWLLAMVLGALCIAVVMYTIEVVCHACRRRRAVASSVEDMLEQLLEWRRYNSALTGNTGVQDIDVTHPDIVAFVRNATCKQCDDRGEVDMNTLGLRLDYMMWSREHEALCPQAP